MHTLIKTFILTLLLSGCSVGTTDNDLKKSVVDIRQSTKDLGKSVDKFVCTIHIANTITYMKEHKLINKNITKKHVDDIFNECNTKETK